MGIYYKYIVALLYYEWYHSHTGLWSLPLWTKYNPFGKLSCVSPIELNERFASPLDQLPFITMGLVREEFLMDCAYSLFLLCKFQHSRKYSWGQPACLPAHLYVKKLRHICELWRQNPRNAPHPLPHGMFPQGQGEKLSQNSSCRKGNKSAFCGGTRNLSDLVWGCSYRAS